MIAYGPLTLIDVQKPGTRTESLHNQQLLVTTISDTI